MLNRLYNRLLVYYLALKNNKIIEIKDDFIVAYNVKRNIYTIWMKQDNGLPLFLESCNSKVNLDFKLNILKAQEI